MLAQKGIATIAMMVRTGKRLKCEIAEIDKALKK